MTGSVVTVQLGQCGNQVGAELFDTLSNEIDAHPSRDRAGIRRAFFREPHRDEDSDAGFNSDDVASTSSRKTPVARAVLIDMEPKVVQASVRRARKTGRWRYDGDRTLAFQSGSGNNWARGYHTYGELVRDEVLDLVRAEAEACDHMGGFMLMQSMAGGEFIFIFVRAMWLTTILVFFGYFGYFGFFWLFWSSYVRAMRLTTSCFFHSQAPEPGWGPTWRTRCVTRIRPPRS
tara:strand:+ start:246 stop:941 length:696 start_codon:yes stop_codon:yes gene_type:complete